MVVYRYATRRPPLFVVHSIHRVIPQEMFNNSNPRYAAIHMRMGGMSGETRLDIVRGGGDPFGNFLKAAQCAQRLAKHNDLPVPVLMVVDDNGVRDALKVCWRVHEASAPAPRPVHCDDGAPPTCLGKPPASGLMGGCACEARRCHIGRRASGAPRRCMHACMQRVPTLLEAGCQRWPLCATCVKVSRTRPTPMKQDRNRLVE